MRRLLFILPAVLFLALAGAFWLVLSSGRDVSELPSVLLDRPVPEFDLPPIEGRPQSRGLKTADFDGVAIVNVFASWCGPCLVEHPLITRLADEGYRVYGINQRDKPADANRWLDRHGDPYARIGADMDSRVSIDWGVTGVPETFLVDAEGRIREKIVGPLSNPGRFDRLREALREHEG